MSRSKLALVGVSSGMILGVALGARQARADEASVTVGSLDDRRYAEPPPRLPDAPAEDPEPYRSPVRFGVGPSGFIAGHAQGFGLGVTTDFGTGTIGLRLAASWMAPGALVSLDQYTGELFLDALPRGPFHPVLGVGFGLAHLDAQGVGGDVGVGIGRLGLEYSFALRDADLRVGASVTGGLPGPRDASVPSDFGAYAVFGGTLLLGF